ncbi:hypothetical protein EVAR_65265_1 [Eumeta japonica]|uniref:Uncharacterized protein n=1 Tax=Eumeta variegata TaxID=151549 RepID=A0A4C1ZAM8_EUMVA|nr:hypothetical protein EVAR_65265_1 [Eumeta japonica]
MKWRRRDIGSRSRRDVAQTEPLTVAAVVRALPDTAHRRTCVHHYVGVQKVHWMKIRGRAWRRAIIYSNYAFATCSRRLGPPRPITSWGDFRSQALYAEPCASGRTIVVSGALLSSDTGSLTFSPRYGYKWYFDNLSGGLLVVGVVSDRSDRVGVRKPAAAIPPLRRMKLKNWFNFNVGRGNQNREQYRNQIKDSGIKRAEEKIEQSRRTNKCEKQRGERPTAEGWGAAAHSYRKLSRVRAR